MKKVLFAFAALFVGVVAFSQDDLDFTDCNPDNYLSAENMKRIEKILTQKESKTGDKEVDDFINGSIDGAKCAVLSNKKLREMYKRQIGATDEDGITDVVMKKPELTDWIELGVYVAEEAKTATDAVTKANEVTTKAKDMGGIKGAKAAKEVSGAANNWKTIGEELNGQLKAIQAIQATLRSNDNH